MIEKILALVAWLLKYSGKIDVGLLLDKIKGIFAFPDWSISDEVRAWVRNLVEMAEMSEAAGDQILDDLGLTWLNRMDDQAVAILRHIVDCDEAWEIFFGMLPSVRPDISGVWATADVGRAHRCLVAAGPATASLDPMVLLQIASVLINLIRMLAGTGSHD